MFSREFCFLNCAEISLAFPVAGTPFPRLADRLYHLNQGRLLHRLQPRDRSQLQQRPLPPPVLSSPARSHRPYKPRNTPHLDHHRHYHASDTPLVPGIPRIAAAVVTAFPLLSSSAAPTDAHTFPLPLTERRHAMMVLADDNAHAMPMAPPRLVPGRRRRRQVMLWDRVAGTRGRNVVRIKSTCAGCDGN